MKRLHLHVGVEDLQQSIKFYSALFSAEPAKTKDDYAKWMLEDPRINFAISTRTSKKGLDHLGLQVDEAAELEELRERAKQADLSVVDQGESVCCYARSEKSWIRDPDGLAWEAYQTMEDAELFSGASAAIPSSDKANACCA